MSKESQVTSDNYAQLAARTESVPKDIPSASPDFGKDKMLRLLHCAMGMCTEAGEIQDQLKRAIFYPGAKLDLDNIIEEAGDMLWYVGVLCNLLDISLTQLLTANINKLHKRYPEGFSGFDALNRNVEAEMEAIQTSIKDDLQNT